MTTTTQIEQLEALVNKTAPAQNGTGSKTDPQAPMVLFAEIKDSNGNIWATIALGAHEFKTGSVGFYGNGKVANPANRAASYQTGFTMTLIGSKK